MKVLKNKLLSRLSLVLGLFAVLGLLAVACGGGGEEAPTNAPAGTGGTAAAGTPSSTAKLGGAGIAKSPRTVRGLDSWTNLTNNLDDGLAIWKTRPLAKDDGVQYCASTSSSPVHSVELLVRALEAAGPDSTREGVLEAIQYAFDGYMCTTCFAPVYLNYTDTQVFETG